MQLRRALRALAIGMALLAVSCGQEPPTTGQAVAVEGDPAAGEQQGTGGEKVVDLPHLPVPNDEGVHMEAATAGTLRADPDTGCVWLELENGNPLALVWYDELRVRFPEDGPAQVEDRAGTVYGVEGQTIELGGGGIPVAAERCDMGRDLYFWAYFPKDWSETS